ELIIFILTAVIIYFLYQIISTTFVLNSPIIQSKDLINNKTATPQELYDDSWRTVKKCYIDSTYNSQDWKRWKKHYQGKLKTDEDARVAIETMLASLDDPYSRFLTKKEYSEQYNSIDSHITGIGINIMNQSGKTVIFSVIKDTPAQKSGLQANDIIMYVDNKSVSGMDISEVAGLVRGPENSSVMLKIKRGNNILTKKITRTKIEIKSVESSVRKGNIGYIKIKSFIGSNTATEFVSALKNVNDTKGIIIDLRGNTGGLLTNAVIVANLFINHGTIVSIVSKNGDKHDINAQMNLPVIEKPTVVLVDEASASASEILSGALKDNKKAILVGSKTFGKGLVQQIVPLPNGTGINITIAKYLTPNGFDINKKGIEPDIKVNYTLSDIKKHNDTQLNKAEAVINDMCK
ncbi:MAG: S41 family peptidase, partial [Candidatus Gastranaerophilales bacterium]|nr:S41 family peptidase [Candidatus Gastranaerophilales bacterium]